MYCCVRRLRSIQCIYTFHKHTSALLRPRRGTHTCSAHALNAHRHACALVHRRARALGHRLTRSRAGYGSGCRITQPTLLVLDSAVSLDGIAGAQQPDVLCTTHVRSDDTRVGFTAACEERTVSPANGRSMTGQVVARRLRRHNPNRLPLLSVMLCVILFSCLAPSRQRLSIARPPVRPQRPSERALAHTHTPARRPRARARNSVSHPLARPFAPRRSDAHSLTHSFILFLCVFSSPSSQHRHLTNEFPRHTIMVGDSEHRTFLFCVLFRV